MTEIKAIETKHNGYRFRSRLEARWAVFFDTLDIRYEYEPEGFDLNPLLEHYKEANNYLDSKNRYYLPDFYLPDYDFYVEIKPSSPFDHIGYRKALLLSQCRKILCILGTWPHLGLDQAYEAARSARF